MNELHPVPRTGAEAPRADVVFVHGLGGDPFATWWHDPDQPKDCWPFWLAEELPEVQVHCLSYPADWTHWFGGEAMPLFDRAKSVLNLFAAEGLGSRPIVFVCHSLGGLVVKQMLRLAAESANPDWQALGRRTRAVMFVATPHAGADLARIAGRLGRVTQATPVMADLAAHAPALRDLNESFRRYVGEAGLHVLCYYETRSSGTKRVPWAGRLLGRVVSAGVKVVEEADADPGVGVTPVPLDADHFGTCKPDRRDRSLCKDLVKLVRTVLAEPEPSAAAGEGEITAAPRAVVPTGPDQLPADLPDFQGREEQIEQLKAILTQGRDGLAEITGMGGVGKSALALHVAYRLADAAPVGRIFVDMGGTSAQLLSPLAAMTRVIQALQPTAQVPPDLEAAQGLYRSCLDGKRVLLLLDNAEHREQVRPLLDWRAPTTLVIVTSRVAIATPGLTAFGLHEMTPDEARALLRAVLAGRPATDAELDDLAERCGRLPLALRVAGTFLTLNRDWTLRDYLDGLADEGRRLGLLRIEDDVRLDVHAAFSARRLARDRPVLAQRWQMLAVFPQSFDRAAAAAVWAAQEAETRRDLGELVRRSLSLYDEADGRYHLHDLMRDVARLPLPGEDEAAGRARLEAARARHARHYCGVLEGAKELYRSGGERVLAGLALYDVEQRNIVAGQAWAAARIEQDDAAARLAAEYANAGAYILGLRMRSREWITWLEAQRKGCSHLGDRRGVGAALGNLGVAWFRLGESRRAIEFYEQHLAIAREEGDRRAEGGSLTNLGLAYEALGEPRRAIEFYEQGLAIAREIGDRRGEENALGSLGNIYVALGDPQRALKFYEEAVAIARDIGDRQREGEGLGSIGLAYADLKEPERAIEHYEEHLAIAREFGDRRSEGKALGNLGLAYTGLGKPQRAVQHHEQDLAIAREIGDRRGEGNALGNIGNVYATLGESRRAMEYYEQQLAITREIGDRRGAGNALYSSAIVLHRSGNHDEAIRRMQEALRIYERIENPWREQARVKLTEWQANRSSD